MNGSMREKKQRVKNDEEKENRIKKLSKTSELQLKKELTSPPLDTFEAEKRRN